MDFDMCMEQVYEKFLVHQVQKRQGVVMIETPRKRVRREGENPKRMQV